VLWIDCSPEAQAEYRRQLTELNAKLNSGVSSVSDRSRSVGYHNPDFLLKAIHRLEDKLAYCTTGGQRASRLSYNPLVKGL
jgi:hypothetical protein